MKLSLVERETILLYNQAEPMAEIYTHDPHLMEKLDLLAKKHPDQIIRKDAHNFTVPKRCVSVLSGDLVGVLFCQQIQLLHQTGIVGVDLSHWFCLVIEENGFPFH